MEPGHGPAVVGDGKVRLQADGLGKVVQGRPVVVERAVGVAAVQVEQRQLGGLPHRLVEIAEGLAVQSQPRADHPAGIEGFHVAGRHAQRLVAVEHRLGQAILDGVDVGAAEVQPRKLQPQADRLRAIGEGRIVLIELETGQPSQGVGRAQRASISMARSQSATAFSNSLWAAWASARQT